MTLSLAIVGRPNVGKSTLFNRLAGKQLALVDDTPGLTRDWREAEGHLYDYTFRIIDTAGLEESFDDSIEARMRKQTEAALKEANAVLFLVDGRAGITPMDEHFARWLRKQKIPVILGVNKCENEKATQVAMAEAYSLGLGDPVALSAAHGTGLDDLYHALEPYLKEGEDEVVGDEELPEEQEISGDVYDELEGKEDFEFEDEEEEEEVKSLKIAIVGRPNAGKSTLLNSILGHERVMTGPEAGITRDAIAVEWLYEGRKFRLVDTAGLRRKAKIVDRIEKMATGDTLRAIRLAQVVILVLDANGALEKQDLQIADHVISEGRALVLAVNKWDAVEDRQEALEEMVHRMSHSLSQVKDIPYITVSALNGKNITKLVDLILKTHDTWNRRVSTAKLNRWLGMMESQHPAPLTGGRPNRLKYMTQIKTRPPTFVLWVSQPGEFQESYLRYLTNGLRESFDIPGVPLRVLVRTSKNPYSER